MKTAEELTALKEKVEAVNKKLRELSDEELAEVTGGGLDVGFVGRSYLLQEGESLSEFAVRHGVTVALLLDLNPEITNVDLVKAGQVIRVPIIE